MKEISASATRIPPRIFNAVAYGGEIACIKRRDDIKVYLVSEKVLEALEDLMGGICAREAIDEAKIIKATSAAWQKKDVEKDIGL